MDLVERFDVLLADAERRELTPRAWWLGRAWHDRAARDLAGAGTAQFEGPRLLRYRDLPVKVLAESPERFALWCQEGALDL